jgi:hypothetical protein
MPFDRWPSMQILQQRSRQAQACCACSTSADPSIFFYQPDLKKVTTKS